MTSSIGGRSGIGIVMIGFLSVSYDATFLGIFVVNKQVIVNKLIKVGDVYYYSGLTNTMDNFNSEYK